MHTNTLTYPHRKTVYNELVGQSENGTLCRSICNQSLPNRLVESMKTSAKTTFSQHSWNVPVLLQKDPSFLDVAVKVCKPNFESRWV
jgi:hypothetical protein